MTTRSKRVVPVVVFGLVGLVASGCGSGATSKASTPATKAESSTSVLATTTFPSTSTASTRTATASVTSAASPCRDGQVAVSDFGGGAGLGHEDQVILFTNHSRSTCTLSGYPRVAGLNAQGRQVAQAERTLGGYLGGFQNGETTFSNVTLAPGQTGSATVEGTDNPVGTATSCPYYPYLLVTPPNLTVSVRLNVFGLGTQPTGLPGCTPIEVHPVVPGSSGRVE